MTSAPTVTQTAARAQAAGAIAAYAPPSLSKAAAAFARTVVTGAAPTTPARAKALLFCVGRLARFGESVGLELSPQVLLADAVIERFIVVGERTISPATRRTLRTNLRALARTLSDQQKPLPVPLAREHAKAPYCDGEIAGYLALAACLSTVSARMRSSALICLGAGAGLIGAELRHVRGCDVICRSGGVIVNVDGRRARVVPVLGGFHAPLLEAARFAGDRYLVGGRCAQRRNLTDALARALSSDRSLQRLQTSRLRATWLCRCADSIGLPTFMAAAGIRCSQRLGDLVAELPAPTEQDLVALLGASA